MPPLRSPSKNVLLLHKRMATSGRARMSKVRMMLSMCASGFAVKQCLHTQEVQYNGKTFHLPKGEHGRVDPEIQKGHIKRMIRQLKIDMECAKEHLELLR